MFFARRPSSQAIDRFVRESQQQPLSYGPVGILRTATQRVDDLEGVIGHGAEDFARARQALAEWKHFELGWVELHPRGAGIGAGVAVAVLIRHLGFWSLNGCRVVYHVTAAAGERRFGFAYGALANHAEAGEELFEVFLQPDTGNVLYRIRAVSWPQAALARLGQPIVRVLQARFRRDSLAAMRRAVS